MAKSKYSRCLALFQFAIALFAFSSIDTVMARKTYIIKEKIQRGDLKVQMPRVRTDDINYCWFKDSGGNQYCITAD